MLVKTKVNLVPFVFQNFSKHDSHMFFKKLIDKKDKVKINLMPKTNEEDNFVTYGCIRVKDSYRFLSSSLDSLVKTIIDKCQKTLKNLKEQIVDNDEILNISKELEDKDRTIKHLKK